MPGRAWAALATTVLALVLVGGCIQQPPPPPDQVVRDSYGKLVAANTARLGTEAATQVGAQRVTVPGTGEIDFARQGYAFTLNVPGLAPIQTVGIGSVSYLQSPQLTAQIPGSKPWLLLDPARLRAAGPAGQELAQTADNPFGQLALVQGAGPDTRLVGTESIDNEPATHYTTTIDFARAKQGRTDPSTAAALDQYAAKVGAPTVPAEVWTDEEGRLRRLIITVPGGAGQPTATATLTFSSLGAPVTTVAAPPPDQTTDLAALLQAAGR